ncbi:glucose 1-dehydrogenase [Mesorhizobium sp.]|uniref:SDR family NAD(P)-dependent oxidoreductase n=1 Tax=Mesorhizobium sp. TaxID=1871066 RepID=UPI000FE803D8|nr:glucose 1-dehydrogenase [Mesorhizobium sp.]RWB69912.1 MAG: glucose 1-dehydrogenase [Mesorhizobium sp.]
MTYGNQQGAANRIAERSNFFAGKVGVITGAGSGLGRSIARTLAAEGVSLVLFDRDARALEEVASESPGSIAIVGDVTCEVDLQRAAAEGFDKLGPANFVVTAAGILGPAESALKLSEEEWDKVFDVNVKGTWLTLKVFVPQVRMTSAGAVVTIASRAGLCGQERLQAYSASKAAVVMLSRSLAISHGPEGIRVNCVCPGSIETPMLEETIQAVGSEFERPSLISRMMAQYPLGRFGRAHEVAETVRFLLSEESSFITGLALPVDGGRSA